MSCTRNNNDAAVSGTIEYPWSQMGNTISAGTIDTIDDKVIFWRKNLFLLPSYSCGKRYIEETTRLLNEWTHDSPLTEFRLRQLC